MFIFLYLSDSHFQVDMKKVNLDVMSKWCTERLTEILGFEDEIVINLAINLLQAPVSIAVVD